jgi:dephospho-CoA kinase
MNKLVCITGLPGSGKSTASDFFVKKGYEFLRFGQITLDEVKRLGLPPIEKNERPIREGFRKKYGMAAFAILNLPKIKKLLKNGNVLGDGLYSFEEYKVLKKEYGDRCKVIAIYSPPELRYQRLKKRKLNKKDSDLRYRPISLKEAKSRDLAEIENLNKGGTIAMADYTIANTKGIQYFYKQLDEVFKEIQKNK